MPEDLAKTDDAVNALATERATELLEQLAVFSDRAAADLAIPATGSPNGRPAFRESPSGVILHYSVDPSLRSTCRWLCDPKQTSSAHFVVSQRLEPWHARHSIGLPQVQALPATAILLRPVDAEANHATWTNAWAHGIELCSSGECRPGHGRVVTRATLDGEARPPDVDSRPLFFAADRCFEAFRSGQLAVAARLCGALRVLSAAPIFHILGHEHVQGVKTAGAGGHDKRDASAALPIDAIRIWSDPRRFVWPINQSFWDIEATRSSPALGFSRSVSTARMQTVESLLRFPDLAIHALALLGYPVRDTTGAELADVVRIFQRMAGLGVDGEIGPKTAAAILSRLGDRFGPPIAAPALA